MFVLAPKKKGATFVAPFFGNPYQRVLSLEPFFPKENLYPLFISLTGYKPLFPELQSSIIAKHEST
jgi:hypothetical protein